MGLFQTKKNVTIKKQKLDIKLPNLGATFLWEEMSGKISSEMTTTKDNVMYVYCLLKASNVDSFTYSFDEFVEIMDEDPKILENIFEILLKKKTP